MVGSSSLNPAASPRATIPSHRRELISLGEIPAARSPWFAFEEKARSRAELLGAPDTEVVVRERDG